MKIENDAILFKIKHFLQQKDVYYLHQMDIELSLFLFILVLLHFDVLPYRFYVGLQIFLV